MSKMGEEEGAPKGYEIVPPRKFETFEKASEARGEQRPSDTLTAAREGLDRFDSSGQARKPVADKSPTHLSDTLGQVQESAQAGSGD